MELTSQIEIVQLVKGAKNKDHRSIEALYKMYYPKMKGVCIKIIKTDGDIAHDLVQNAFIHALISLHTLHNEERFGEWLTTITRNVSLKYLQKKNKVRFIPLSELPAEDACLFSQTDNSESLANFNEIKSLLQQIPKGYGEVFRLSVIEGYSHAEIGKMLGIAPHSSSSQLARAKTLLRRLLKDRQLVLLMMLLLFAMPCTILWLHLEENNDKELAKHNPKTKKRHKAIPAAPSDPINQTQQDIQLPLAKGATHRVVDTTAIAMPSHAEVQDSVAIKIDSLIHEFTQQEVYIAQAVPSKSSNSEWQLMASGTINFEAEHKHNKSIAVADYFPELPDGPVSEIPQSIRTWEQYAQYLNTEMYDNPSDETQALLDVAERNSGEIIEQEHHCNPISIGIALSKKMNDKLSIETGIQYDRLNSTFTTGSATNNITEQQRIDYLGIPFRTTYRMVNYKSLSVYGTAGFMLHVPLYGSYTSDYVIDGSKTYHFNSSVKASEQWTIPLGIGVQYQLTPHIGLYAQPTLNWHVPGNGNVRTMWTKYPWQVNVPVGIRFTW